MSVNSSNSSHGSPKSSAISNPRCRRFIWYENKLTDVAELGFYLEAKFIFTKFDHDGGYDCEMVEKMQEHVTKKWPKLELLHCQLSVLKFYFDGNQVDAKTEDEFLNDFLHLNKIISNFARKYNRPGAAKSVKSINASPKLPFSKSSCSKNSRNQHIAQTEKYGPDLSIEFTSSTSGACILISVLISILSWVETD